MPVTKLAPSILMRMGQVHRRTPMNRNGLLGSMSHHHRRDPTPPHQRLRPKIDQKGSLNRGQVRYESSGVRAAGLIRILMFSGSELANQARDINREPNYGSLPCLRLYSLPRFSSWTKRAHLARRAPSPLIPRLCYPRPLHHALLRYAASSADSGLHRAVASSSRQSNIMRTP